MAIYVLCTIDKKKRKAITIEEKQKIISRIEKGEKIRKLSCEFKLSSSTIGTIWKNREAINLKLRENCRQIKRFKKSQNEDIDKALFTWFKIQRSRNIPLNGAILQLKAEELAKKMGKEDYTCSASWIQRFRKRHNIVFGKIHGESANVDSNVCNNWISNIWPKIRENYTDNQIFNADETSIFYKLTPDKSFHFKNEKCSNGKFSKDRITVLLCSNMTGTVKKELLVIGKAKKPRCLKNVHFLPVSYEGNKRAWMTSSIFEDFLWKWDRKLKQNGEKVLLVVDNCPSHPSVENLSSIKLVFLPPNVTSILQPLDQGVIRSFKGYYRRLLILKMLEEEKADLKVSILDSILMLHDAWDSVSVSTIKNCFKHAGFYNTAEIQHLSNPLDGEKAEDDIPLSELRNIVRQCVDWNTYITVDDGVATSATVLDEEIIHACQDADTEDDICEDEDFEFNAPSLKAALQAVQTLRNFYICNEGYQSFNQHIVAIEKNLQSSFLKSAAKQTKITDFLK